MMNDTGHTAAVHITAMICGTIVLVSVMVALSTMMFAPKRPYPVHTLTCGDRSLTTSATIHEKVMNTICPENPQ